MIPTLEDIIRGLLDGTMTHEAARAYLAEHERLQAHVDNMQVPRYEVASTIMHVIAKTNEQDARWGLRHYPSFNQAVASNADSSPIDIAQTHGVRSPPETLVWLRESRFDEMSWMDILMGEVGKLCLRFDDSERLRSQLHDVAGVAVQWAAQLEPDRELQFCGQQIIADETLGDHEGPGERAYDPA